MLNITKFTKKSFFLLIKVLDSYRLNFCCSNLANMICSSCTLFCFKFCFINIYLFNNFSRANKKALSTQSTLHASANCLILHVPCQFCRAQYCQHLNTVFYVLFIYLEMESKWLKLRISGNKFFSHNVSTSDSSSCVGAAHQVSFDWSQKTKTCHSFNCFSIVWGQGQAPLVTDSSEYILAMMEQNKSNK